jgi:hypothetical protein
MNVLRIPVRGSHGERHEFLPRECGAPEGATVRLGRRPALPLAGPGHELGRRNSGRPTGSLRHGDPFVPTCVRQEDPLRLM